MPQRTRSTASTKRRRKTARKPSQKSADELALAVRQALAGAEGKKYRVPSTPPPPRGSDAALRALTSTPLKRLARRPR